MGKENENYYYWKIRRALTRLIFNDRQYTERRFTEIFGRPLDLDNSKTFNEKINWLKLYYRRPRMQQLVDKYSANEYIETKIGGRQFPKTAGGLRRSAVAASRSTGFAG